LIVEDEILIAIDIEQMVQDAGHIVVGKAVDLASCKEVAASTRPDLALMDMRLKNADSGEDAARWLRAELGIRCVFVSGNLDEATRERLEPLEPLAFVGKPILPSKLLDVLARLRMENEPRE
jgi:AmiR/NasT family two-component response regulator